MSNDGHCKGLQDSRRRELHETARRTVMFHFQWDKHGRLWGHEWEAVAWMAKSEKLLQEIETP